MRSYRRILLDNDLEASKDYLKGVVLDIGGGRQRGLFKPPEGTRWLVLDSNPESKPDILGDAQNIPLEPGTVDSVKCTELLEHVSSPDRVIEEITRVLKPGGSLVLSIPFNSRIHADPFDYQRLTDNKLTELLARDFDIVTLKKQGAYFTVLADMLQQGILHASRFWRLWLYPLLLLPGFLVKLEGCQSVKNSAFLNSFTTGFFVVAVRK